MSVITSINPATGVQIGQVATTSESEVKMVVQRARLAQPAWAALGFKKRAEIIFKARRLILEQMDDIAALISNENGKPVIEAISHDIMPSMDLMTFYAKNSQKLLKKETIKLGKWAFMGHQSEVEYIPWGVVGVISPWNFPFSIPLGGVVMALMVGNTVVLKPSEYTPLIGQKILQILNEAGLPADVLQVIQGNGAIGGALVKSGVDKIMFTGSVPTGKKIMAAAADLLTPVTLELGGKDPLIVLNDADLEMASSAAVWGAFCNSGQVCASIERVYVHESIARPFTKLVVEKTLKLRQGRGDTDVDVGSMTAEMQVKKVEAQVADAKARGAKILTGGERNTALQGPNLQGLFYKPTVLTGVTHDFAIVKDESFGPVLPIMTYASEDEAVRLANDSPYALNAYIWAGDLGRGRRLASRIEAGTVNVNESVFTYALPQTPWGGPKESGIGRTHGAQGLMDLVNVRHVHVSKWASKKNNFWWYGYSPDKLAMIKALCAVLFGRGMERVRGVAKFLKLSRKVKTM